MTLSVNILQSFVLYSLSASKYLLPASSPNDVSLGHVYAHRKLSTGWGTDFVGKSHSDQT